jgi:hypothetical protein
MWLFHGRIPNSEFIICLVYQSHCSVAVDDDAAVINTCVPDGGFLVSIGVMRFLKQQLPSCWCCWCCRTDVQSHAQPKRPDSYRLHCDTGMRCLPHRVLASSFVYCRFQTDRHGTAVHRLPIGKLARRRWRCWLLCCVQRCFDTVTILSLHHQCCCLLVASLPVSCWLVAVWSALAVICEVAVWYWWPMTQQ